MGPGEAGQKLHWGFVPIAVSFARMASRDLLCFRSDVVGLLEKNLPGQNLYDLAETYGVTVLRDGKLNKGWVGQTIERAGGLTINNLHGPDGEDFELKSTTLLRDGDGWKPQETIKITQFSPGSILDETFETSSLWKKLSRLIVVGCARPSERECIVVRVNTFDLNDPELVAGVRDFWEEMRSILAAGDMGIYDSQGSSVGLLQLRPTGNRQNSSRCPITGEKFQAKAFYATKTLVKAMLRL